MSDKRNEVLAELVDMTLETALKVIENTTEEQLRFVPAPGSRSGLWRFWHMLTTLDFLVVESAAGKKRVKDFYIHTDKAAEHEVPSKDALLAYAAELKTSAREAILSLPAKRLDQSITMPWKKDYLVRWCVLHAAEHIAIHTGQIQVIRRLLGLEPV
jgi:uncharacterized damage-inducible protein DinB